jgi:thiol-disulfide isomerase/thioredoxin
MVGTRTWVRVMRGAWFTALLVVCGAAAGSAPEAGPSGPRAPALSGRDWINSAPLTKADFKGKVRLVEFWAFECVNCQRTVPAMKRLFTMYGGTGDVVIVGVHTPELPHEKDARAVQRAVTHLGLPYPILLDNYGSNWDAFENKYWPALYMIDRRGVIRDVHIGELHEDTPAWRAVVSLIDSLRREPA